MCLGGFKNIRQDYKYEGLKMELDETSYEWGTCYEIEIETVRSVTPCALALSCFAKGPDKSKVISGANHAIVHHQELPDLGVLGTEGMKVLS